MKRYIKITVATDMILDLYQERMDGDLSYSEDDKIRYIAFASDDLGWLGESLLPLLSINGDLWQVEQDGGQTDIIYTPNTLTA